MGKNINDDVGQNIGEMYLPKCICAPHFFSFFSGQVYVIKTS